MSVAKERVEKLGVAFGKNGRGSNLTLQNFNIPV